MSKQIKSKDRVAKHGEVFTAEREVEAMLDLVKSETDRVDSRFLEPACGDGNFLTAILKRKLAVVTRRYKKSPFEWEVHGVLALTSMYGVDIQGDNVNQCRERLLEQWCTAYKKHTKRVADADLIATLRHILKHNILHGDALTMKKDDGNPIVFAQWDMVFLGKFQRRDYRLDELIAGNAPDREPCEEIQLFDGDQPASRWTYDDEIHGFIPAPIKDDYPLTDYREMKQYD